MYITNPISYTISTVRFSQACYAEKMLGNGEILENPISILFHTLLYIHNDS